MKIWRIDHNQVIADLEKDYEVVERIEDADVVLLWNDVNPVERGIISYAHSLGKKVAVMQHGRKGSSRYYPPFNEEITADLLLVWGEFDRQRLIAAGRDPEKIRVVGTTVFSHLVPRETHEGMQVVFCPEHWDRPVPENHAVASVLRTIPGVTITTKIIESHDATEYQNPVRSERSRPDHLAICARVLARADLVVGISESTFELLAQSLDIPVVIMEEWSPKSFGGDERYCHYERLISRAAHRSSLADLPVVIDRALRQPELLREERRKVAIEEGGLGLDSRVLVAQALHELR